MKKLYMENFISKQRAIYPLSDEAVHLFLQEAEEIRFAKGERIFTQGQRMDYVYFVKEGFARVYMLHDGKDMTLWFTAPGEMMAGPSKTALVLNAELLEDSILLKMAVRKLEELYNHSLELANWGRKMAEHYLAEYEYYFINYSCTDAKTQYERLLHEYPDLIKRVPLKHIASYLQITPQSLSRIRAIK